MADTATAVDALASAIDAAGAVAAVTEVASAGRLIGAALLELRNARRLPHRSSAAQGSCEVPPRPFFYYCVNYTT